MKSVLFVDDNRLLSRLSCDILRTAGYRAVPAYSAAEALDAFEHHNFDIVVTDMRMENMDGLQLARAIREKNPHMPVIMVTGYDPVEADEIHVCLPKERLFPTLLDHIRECLSKPDKKSA